MISFKEAINNDMKFEFSIDVENNIVVVESDKTSIMCSVALSDEDIQERSFSESGCKPLTVFFESRFNAVNKIPGGFKKKDMPSDQDVLISRLIDRCIRPLISNEFTKEIKIYISVLNYSKYSLEVLSVLGASLLLNILGVLDSPVSLCKISGEKVNSASSDCSLFKFLSAFSSDNVVMIDYEAMNGISLKNIESYRTVLDKAFKITSSISSDFNEMQNKILSKINSKKQSTKSIGFFERLNAWWLSRKIFNVLLSSENYSVALKSIDSMDHGNKKSYIFNSYLRDLIFSKMGGYVLKCKQRLDSRPLIDGINLQIDSDIRESKFHKSLVYSQKGCNLFSRGNTQVVSSIAIGDSNNALCIDSLDGRYNEYFWVNYNFSPALNTKKNAGKRDFAGSSRREIGHSDLIKKSFSSLLTDQSNAIRVVCDVISSDGSSSMVSVCGASMLLYQNKIISSLVGGVSIGLIKHENKKSFFVDLNHFEDEFLSLMDCKVTGTREAITAMHLDVKKIGLDYKDFSELLKIAVVKLNEVLDLLEPVAESKQEKSIIKKGLFNDDFFRSKKKMSLDVSSDSKKNSSDSRKNEKKVFDTRKKIYEPKKTDFQHTSKLDSRRNEKFINEDNNVSVKQSSLVFDIDTVILDNILSKRSLKLGDIGKDFDVYIKIEGINKLRITSKNHKNILKAIKLIRSLIKI